MKNLMKYEFRKTLAVKMLVLGAAALAECLFLIGLWGDMDRVLAMSIFLLTMLAFGSVMVIGLASVVILHRDMNTKQSYMLFMTPNSCYRILGAKVLENGLSILLSGAFFFALGALDITLLFARQGSLAELWDTFTGFLRRIDERITLDAPTMMTLTANVLSTWICTVTAAYLGDVISTALLNGKRFNGLLSFLAFVLLMWLTGFVQMKTVGAIGDIRTAFLAETAVALVFSAVMYVLTAQIMERKLSV